MNQKNGKNSLGIDSCFEEADNPIDLFKNWFSEAEKSEINDPNAVAVATSDKDNQPNVRMVLLKGLSDKGFVFYTNFNSKKGSELKINQKASMCFHWKSLRRQVRISGEVEEVTAKEADDYYLQQQSRYPVIFLTLKDIKKNTFEDAYSAIATLMRDLYQQHKVANYP